MKSPFLTLLSSLLILQQVIGDKQPGVVSGSYSAVSGSYSPKTQTAQEKSSSYSAPSPTYQASSSSSSGSSSAAAVSSEAQSNYDALSQSNVYYYYYPVAAYPIHEKVSHLTILIQNKKGPLWNCDTGSG